MPSSRTIRRYAAYFRGWATAFGTHDKDFDEARDVLWLFADEQIGLILTPGVKRFLYPRFLGHRAESAPLVTLGPGVLAIEDTQIELGDEDKRAFERMMELMQASGDLHLYQTYHLFYPTGTRILTLSRRAPLPLVYREIAPLTVRLDQAHAE